MCDTVVALGNATADGSVLFAKNSDRDPNEAHCLTLVPASSHDAGSEVKCTYISIPQVERTNAVLLAKPFWIWGAEMGCNDQGVVIGNEAVFSKEPYGREPGLIGMDFLRLALERTGTAYDAMMCIIQLLELYGQSGNCGFSHPFYYHNSFLIADRKTAWVLETAAKRWVAQQVKDVRSISNGYTIHSEWDMASPDLENYAVERGWHKKGNPFDFARSYADFIYTRFSDGGRRHHCATELLLQKRGSITVESMVDLLRFHEEDQSTSWSPDRALVGQNICAHAGFGPIRISQSVGSMVSQMSETGDTHWFTATSAPCTGVFKPVWMDAGLPEMGSAPTGEYDETSLWWQHEMLHREILRNYPARLGAYLNERDQMESDFFENWQRLKDAPVQDRAAFSQDCFNRSSEKIKSWLAAIRGSVPESKQRFYHVLTWKQLNQQAKLPLK